MTTSDTDFIIIGAGPAGCTLATTLSRANSSPKVILLEAGLNDGKDELDRIPEQRFYHWISERAKQSILPYQTVPQQYLNGRRVAYTRGTGIGGTSTINFSMWTIPPSDWHEQMVELTGDREWSWNSSKQRYKRIENVNPSMTIPKPVQEHIRVTGETHGTTGSIRCGFPDDYEQALMPELELWGRHGNPVNRDGNDGNPLGLSICWNSIRDGLRSTAADMLDYNSSNLEIRTGARVVRVLFDTSNVASGVLLANGETLSAKKEVILCAGALDSPRILLHSGIGPREQLDTFGLPVEVDSAHVGQNLQDHYHCPFVLGRDEVATKNQRGAFYRSADARESALKQWKADRTGPLSELGGAVALVMKKLEGVEDSEEKASLPDSMQEYLNYPTIPNIEFLLNGPNFGLYQAPHKVPPSQAYVAMLTNPQSRGSAVLQSADPDVPLLFDPGFLSHPYDKRVVLEATRELMNTLEEPDYAKDTTMKLWWPKSQDEEDVLSYWRDKANSTWHMSGTVGMGRESGTSCVDENFKVWGVERLRVVDLSVLPLLPPTHPQTVAYLIGLVAADKIIYEFALNTEENVDGIIS